MSLSQQIRELVANWKELPQEINCGLCADFAHALWGMGIITRDHIVSDEDMDGITYTHTFLQYEGRFYDAEAPDGVDDWIDLPIYHRQRQELKSCKCNYTRNILLKRLGEPNENAICR